MYIVHNGHLDRMYAPSKPTVDRFVEQNAIVRTI